MKKNSLSPFFILLMGAVLYFVAAAFESQGNCGGVDRHDVKTLQDTGLKHIKFVPIQSTVGNLRLLTHIIKIGNNTPRFGAEFNCYQIDCRIREYRIEDDGDVHLVLVDIKDSSKTIIGEIPDINCDKIKTSKFIKNFVNAHMEFENFSLSHHKVKEGIYTITGVCFFDKVHGQLGVAPNGIELHPIMDIVKGR